MTRPFSPLPDPVPGQRPPPAVLVGCCELGRGLFAAADLARGSEILLLAGPELSFEEMVAKGEAEANALQIADDRFLDLEAPGVYANHSCLPNAGIRSDRVLIALQTIRRGEEIRYDYSTTMWENHWTMACRCGQANCRGIIDDFPTLPSEQQRHYLALNVVQSFIVERLQRERRRH